MDRYAHVAAGILNVRTTEMQDLLRLLEGSTAEQCAIDNAEHRCSQTDARGKGENRNYGQSGTLDQQTHAVAHVLPEVVPGPIARVEARGRTTPFSDDSMDNFWKD